MITPSFSATVKNKELIFDNLKNFKKFLEKFEDTKVSVIVRKPIRTNLQNSSLHLFCSCIADSLNEKHLYFNNNFFKKDFEIEWNSEMVKNLIWRPIQKSTIQKKSTKRLTTKEVGEIAEIIIKNFSLKFGIILNFPEEQKRQLGIKKYEIT